jgi:hypothetical protein
MKKNIADCRIDIISIFLFGIVVQFSHFFFLLFQMTDVMSLLKKQKHLSNWNDLDIQLTVFLQKFALVHSVI